MTFNPRIEAGSTVAAPSEEYNHVGATQEPSASLSGRVVAYLPAGDNVREKWKTLGIKWLESLDEGPFLAQALLPEGWSAESSSGLYSGSSDITIVDAASQKQAIVSIITTSYSQEAIVFFVRIEKKSLDQTEEKEQRVIENEFEPVYYPGRYIPLYCTYEEIISAIESWGKVEAILTADNGGNHIFIVSFKKPINFTSYEEGILVNLEGGGICHTPFCLREMDDGVILSHNMMAFDIRHLHVGSFSGLNLLHSERLLPDERIRQIRDAAGRHPNWKEIEKKIDSTFSESDKAKKIVEWIKQSGLLILEKGLYRNGDDAIGQYSVEEIIARYTNLKGFFPWQVLMQAESK